MKKNGIVWLIFTKTKKINVCSMFNKLQLLLIIIGYFFTFLYANLTYSELRKNEIYPYLSAFITLILGFLWGFLAKSGSDGKGVYNLGVIWDVGVNLIWILVPLVLCGVSLNIKQSIGVILLMIGCLMINMV